MYALNSHGYPVRTEMTAPSLHVFLRMRTNQKESSCTKLYCRAVLRTRANKKASLSAKLYRRAAPRTRTNYVLRRKTNQNALLRNKNTQRMRLNMTCRTILTPLMYSNEEERFWKYLTCNVKECAWPLQNNNTLWRCWIL